jgi:hypothetical protein
MIIAIHPAMGTIHSNCHQPLRSVSWSRRAPAARDGTTNAKLKIVCSGLKPPAPKMLASTIVVAKLPSIPNSANHQNSGRRARPEKSAYLVRHAWTAPPNVSGFPKPGIEMFATPGLAPLGGAGGIITVDARGDCDIAAQPGIPGLQTTVGGPTTPAFTNATI